MKDRDDDDIVVASGERAYSPTQDATSWVAKQKEMCLSSGVMLFFGAGGGGKTSFATAAVKAALKLRPSTFVMQASNYMPLASAHSLLSYWLSPSLIKQMVAKEVMTDEECSSIVSEALAQWGVNGSSVADAISSALGEGNRAVIDAFTFELARRAAEVRASYQADGSESAAELAAAFIDVSVWSGSIVIKQGSSEGKSNRLSTADSRIALDSACSVASSLCADATSVFSEYNVFHQGSEIGVVYVGQGESAILASPQFGFSTFSGKATAAEVEEFVVNSRSADLNGGEDELTDWLGCVAVPVDPQASVHGLFGELVSNSLFTMKESLTSPRPDTARSGAKSSDVDALLVSGASSAAEINKLISVVDAMPLIELHHILAASGLYEYLLAALPGYETPCAKLARWFGSVSGISKRAVLARTEYKSESLYGCVIHNDSLENRFSNLRLRLPTGEIRVSPRASMLTLVFGAMLMSGTIHFSAVDKTAARSLAIENSTQKGGLDSVILNATQNLNDFCAQIGTLVIAELRDDFTTGAGDDVARKVLGANSHFACHVTKPKNDEVSDFTTLAPGSDAVGRDVWIRTKSYRDDENSSEVVFKNVTMQTLRELLR